jgi:hypothetical protein
LELLCSGLDLQRAGAHLPTGRKNLLQLGILPFIVIEPKSLLDQGLGNQILIQCTFVDAKVLVRPERSSCASSSKRRHQQPVSA